MPLRDVYANLGQARASVIVLMESGRPRMRVNALPLIKSVLEACAQKPEQAPQIFDLPIGDAANRFAGESANIVHIKGAKDLMSLARPPQQRELSTVVRTATSTPTPTAAHVMTGQFPVTPEEEK